MNCVVRKYIPKFSQQVVSFMLIASKEASERNNTKRYGRKYIITIRNSYDIGQNTVDWYVWLLAQLRGVQDAERIIELNCE